MNYDQPPAPKQCKDLDTDTILRAIHAINITGHWVVRYSPEFLEAAFPPDTPEKLILAKMRKLIAKDIVLGCSCGCRGDYTLSNATCDRLGLRHVNKWYPEPVTS